MTCVCNQQGMHSHRIWTARPWFLPWCISMNIPTRRADNSVGLWHPHLEQVWLHAKNVNTVICEDRMELQQRLCPPVKPVTGRRGEHGPRVKTAANSIMLVDELVLAKSIHNEIRYYLVRTPNVLFTLEIVEIKKKRIIICSVVRLKRFISVLREATRDLPSTSVVQFKESALLSNTQLLIPAAYRRYCALDTDTGCEQILMPSLKFLYK